MGRSYAGILGPLAFSLIVARGVLLGAGVNHTLFTASIGLFACGGLGYVVGQIAQSTVDESVRTRFAVEMQSQGDTTSPNETPRNTA